MKILVTGGCGFVGAALCRRFLASRTGLAITVLDSLRRRGSETNVDDLRARGVGVVHGDVRVPADIDPLGPFDWVIDAAAEPSVLAGTAADAHTGRRGLVDHNLLGTVNLLEAAARWRAGVVLLSTSRVYSIPALAALPLAERPGRGGAAFAIDRGRPLPAGVSAAGLTEVFTTAAPVSLYGATKLAGETLSEDDALDALEAVGLIGREDLACKYLSQGQKRRVALSRLVHERRALWVLDEPFVALDVAAVGWLAGLIGAHL